MGPRFRGLGPVSFYRLEFEMQGSDNRPEEDSLQAAVTFILPVAGQMV